MAASCVHAEGLRSRATEHGTSARQLADAFCAQARLRIEHRFDRLWDNTDNLDRRLADEVLSGRISWLEAGIIDGSEGTGPWIAEWRPGPSNREGVARRYR